MDDSKPFYIAWVCAEKYSSQDRLARKIVEMLFCSHPASVTHDICYLSFNHWYVESQIEDADLVVCMDADSLLWTDKHFPKIAKIIRMSDMAHMDVIAEVLYAVGEPSV